MRNVTNKSLSASSDWQLLIEVSGRSIGSVLDEHNTVFLKVVISNFDPLVISINISLSE